MIKIYEFKCGGGLVAKSCPTLATLWTVAFQAPLSMGFSRQECWCGLPRPPAGIFPTQGSDASLLCLLHGQAGPLPLAPSHSVMTSGPWGRASPSTQPTATVFFFFWVC